MWNKLKIQRRWMLQQNKIFWSLQSIQYRFVSVFRFLLVDFIRFSFNQLYIVGFCFVSELSFTSSFQHVFHEIFVVKNENINVVDCKHMQSLMSRWAYVTQYAYNVLCLIYKLVNNHYLRVSTVHTLDVLMYYESSKILVFQTQNILKTSYVIQWNYDDHSIAVANFGFCSVDEWFNLHYNVARLSSWAALLRAVFLFRYKCNFKHFSRWRFGIGFVVVTNHCHYTVTVLQWIGNV